MIVHKTFPLVNSTYILTMNFLSEKYKTLVVTVTNIYNSKL